MKLYECYNILKFSHDTTEGPHIPEIGGVVKECPAKVTWSGGRA